MKRFWHWWEERTGLGGAIGRVLRHPVPPGARWHYVFGSATLVAFLIQVGTGIALATVYVPSAKDAYSSLGFITHGATLGHFLRGMHYFGASAMMLLIGIHIIRVYLTASYKYPREVNWLTGAILLALTVTMAFTGQLLRWDQNAVWSVIVAAEQAGRVPGLGTPIAHFILGGDHLGGATLSRFFAFHIFFIPALIYLFIAAHLFLVLRNGISEPPKLAPQVDPATERQRYATLLRSIGQPFWPDSMWRDVVFGCLVLAVVVALAIWVGPPELGRAPNPSIITASPRPDWYFLWYFAVLAVLPPSIEPYFMVLAPVCFGIALIALPFAAGAGYRTLRHRPWAVVIVVIAIGIVGYFWWLGERAPWSPRFAAQPLPARVVSANDTLVRAGARLFHEKGCEFCHTIAGEGGIRGPNLSDVASRLNRAQIASRILGGGTNMPAYVGTLTSDELKALVAFLETRRTGAAVPLPAGDPLP